MTEHIQEQISVITLYNALNGKVLPKKILWRGREYIIEKLGYHHSYYQGRTLIHIFHVTDGKTAFRLRLDTGSLHWMLEETYDAFANQ